MSSANKSKKSKGKARSGKRSQTNWVLIAGAVGLVGLIAIAALILTRPSTTSSDSASGSLPAEINVDQAYAMYENGAFVLDVRTPEEWNEYHAPNTTLIPLDELASRVNELPRDQQIVVVCRSGNRSQVGRDTLRNAGFTQVTSMAGGLKAWQAAGYPTVSGP